MNWGGGGGGGGCEDSEGCLFTENGGFKDPEKTRRKNVLRLCLC